MLSCGEQRQFSAATFHGLIDVYLQVATLLLTKCAAAGLTLAEIGLVASRQLVGMQEEPSQLESICLAARAAVDAATEEFDSDSSECDMADEELQSQTRKLSLSGNLALGELGRSSFVMGIQVSQNQVSVKSIVLRSQQGLRL